MGDGVAAELVVAVVIVVVVAIGYYESQAAFGEELDALGEDFITFWKVGVDLGCDAGEAWDVGEG